MEVAADDAEQGNGEPNDGELGDSQNVRPGTTGRLVNCLFGWKEIFWKLAFGENSELKSTRDGLGKLSHLGIHKIITI